MPTVLHFQSSFSAVIRRVATEVRDFAAKAGWRLHVVPYANAAEREDDRFGNVLDAAGLAALLDEWRPDGCIVHWSPVWPDLARSMPGVPCVSIDDPNTAPSVCPDNAAIGRAAAEELLRLGLASFATLSLHRPAYWCGERAAAFAAAVRERGFEAVDLGDAGESVNAVSDSLIAALLQLPRPCGLFAVNDLVARRALDAAAAAGLDVPYDLAVVGADDDESVCEHPGASLTSVRPDFERLGRAACQRLEQILAMAAAPSPPRHAKRFDDEVSSPLPACLRVGGETVVRRASSRRLLRRDALVSAVLEDIRKRYAERITVASLAQERGVFLRTLERRFRRATGRPIGHEIADARFRAAQRMLAEPPRRGIDAIANLCGYESASTLRKAFRTRLGLSPRDWRAARIMKRSR